MRLIMILLFCFGLAASGHTQATLSARDQGRDITIDVFVPYHPDNLYISTIVDREGYSRWKSQTLSDSKREHFTVRYRDLPPAVYSVTAQLYRDRPDHEEPWVYVFAHPHVRVQ